MTAWLNARRKALVALTTPFAAWGADWVIRHSTDVQLSDEWRNTLIVLLTGLVVHEVSNADEEDDEDDED